MSVLQQIATIEKEADDFGFAWPDVDSILQQITSECAEVKRALAEQEPPQRVQEEIGDVLHAAISLCVFAGFDVTETLEQVTQKISGRFAKVKMLAAQQGYTSLKNQPIEVLMALWDEAKTAVVK